MTSRQPERTPATRSRRPEAKLREAIGPTSIEDLARQSRDLPLDAHLHTDLSPDADVPIDAYAAEAVERGIDEIAVTDHVDFVPGTPAFSFASFSQRERV